MNNPGKPAESSRTTEFGRREASTATAQTEEGSKLIVGPNIKLKGSEITDCEILVVEGRVEASMKSRVIRIAEGGVFAGKAEIDVAEVRGSFEGELTVRERLVVYATGNVTGTLRYGAMMIEDGGTLAGDVATLAAGPARVAEKPAAPSEPVLEKAADTEANTSGAAMIRSLGKRQA
ncbi:MAG TPA: polymer-forming cytoskeletal protein [Thiobacillaceae bacterium]|nr:polymer-forming cytoskeletal protein [Thiobacillaceae bacterium]